MDCFSPNLDLQKLYHTNGISPSFRGVAPPPIPLGQVLKVKHVKG